MKKAFCILLVLTMVLAVASAALAENLLVKDGKPVKVVYVANEVASDWQAISTQYLKALVEADGGTCQIYDPQNDSAAQAQMIEDALILDPDVLVVKPIDAAAIVPALKQVNAAKIPIILLDTGIIDEAGVEILTFIQTDQLSLGGINAEYVSKVYAEKGEEAKVVTVLGDMTSTIAQQRQKGFNDKAKELGNVTVLAETESKWDPSDAYTAVMDMFTRHPEANTVFNCADCMQSGVIRALKDLGRLVPMGEEGHVTVVSIDADPSGCSYIAEGYCDQCAEHNAALHSDIAYKVIVDYVHGYEIPGTIFFPTNAVNKDNLDSSDRWGTKDISTVATWGVMEHDHYVMQTPAQ